MSVQPITDILERVERAIRNGTRVHLELDQAIALVESPAYATLAALKQKELIAKCKRAKGAPLETSPSDSSSGIIGSGTARIETTGTSAGSMAVQLAAEELALEEANNILHLSRRKRH